MHGATHINLWYDHECKKWQLEVFLMQMHLLQSLELTVYSKERESGKQRAISRKKQEQPLEPNLSSLSDELQVSYTW